MQSKMFEPKINSKNQQKKRDAMAKNPLKYVSCSECGETNTTLYKTEIGYLCEKCNGGIKC